MTIHVWPCAHPGFWSLRAVPYAKAALNGIHVGEGQRPAPIV